MSLGTFDGPTGLVPADLAACPCPSRTDGLEIRPFGGNYSPIGPSYASANTVSVLRRLKASLSMNRLHSSASSFITEVISRTEALSWSTRTVDLFKYWLALRKTRRAATLEGGVRAGGNSTRNDLPVATLQPTSSRHQAHKPDTTRHPERL